MPEFLQTYGAWIGFAAFILVTRLLGGLGDKVWKQKHDTREEDDDSEID